LRLEFPFALSFRTGYRHRSFRLSLPDFLMVMISEHRLCERMNAQGASDTFLADRLLLLIKFRLAHFALKLAIRVDLGFGAKRYIQIREVEKIVRIVPPGHFVI
jgi:hypothetical protein